VEDGATIRLARAVRDGLVELVFWGAWSTDLENESGRSRVMINIARRRAVQLRAVIVGAKDTQMYVSK